MKKFIFASFCTFIAYSSLFAWQIDASLGAHDFIVSDIKDDTPMDHIEAGTSHTLGLNIGVYASHTTDTGIDILAKAEAFLDRDKDHLDPDHIPVWFDFLFQANGSLYRFSQNNSVRWRFLADNKQNTVSCVERQVRQHIGVSYLFEKGGFSIEASAYAGFYYIEFDDDTPVARGYERMQLDDGEASNIFAIDAQYKWDRLNVSGYARRYGANAGGKWLETQLELLLSYKIDLSYSYTPTLNLKIRSSKYELDRFYDPSKGIPVLPFDNDTLIQAYLKVPIFAQ